MHEKVLVVDDSLMYREILSRGLSLDPNIEIVATAVDAFDARDKILKYEPDIMTCDIEMPKMNGIEFIRQLLPQYPLAVVVVSTVSDAVFDAMSVGAVDFIEKPSANSVEDIKEFIANLIYKVKIAVTANINISEDKTIDKTINYSKDTDVKKESNFHKVIAIGASTGGTEAISSILKLLPTSSPGIVIAQHIPPRFSTMFANRLNDNTKFIVKEAKTGDLIEPGKVLVAPGNKHMRVKKQGKHYKVECFDSDKVNGHRPSVDVLFESVAEEYKENATGVILTGMGYDGAKGLLSMRQKGAKTIGQDKESCVVYGMPQVAHNIGAVEKQVSLEKIPIAIAELL